MAWLENIEKHRPNLISKLYNKFGKGVTDLRYFPFDKNVLQDDDSVMSLAVAGTWLTNWRRK